MQCLIVLAMVLLHSGLITPDNQVSATPFIVDFFTPTDDECTTANESSVCNPADCPTSGPEIKRKCALVQHYAKKESASDAATTNRFFNATLRYRKCICEDMCSYPEGSKEVPLGKKIFMNDIDQETDAPKYDQKWYMFGICG